MNLSHLPLFFFLSLALGVASPSAFARWATLSDAPAISDYDRLEVRINKDGSSVLNRETLIEIRNEEGRKAFGTGSVKYNAQTGKISSLAAKTINPDATYAVTKDYIEDKSVASSAEGFDDTRQLSFAYPKVEVGSKLYLKYTEKTTEVPFANFYSDEVYFGSEIYEKTGEATYLSESPLYTHENDPEDHLEVVSSRDGKLYKVKILLKRPVYARVIDEEAPFLTQDRKTWVIVSTSQSYTDLPRTVAGQYEKIINSKLPAPFEKILQAAAKETKLTDRINRITSQLADEVRYLGDWRPTQGGHVPRPLDVIASTKFGDCKDYSVVTAAILRRLGVNARIAWVERGPQGSPLPKVTLDTAFNHAIVAVEDGKEIRWIDPTNYVSFAQGIFEDIMDRPAMIVDPTNSEVKQIPLGRPDDSLIRKYFEVTFTGDSDANLRAELSYSGRGAASMAGISREVSRESINHLISKSIAEDNYVKWSKVEDFDLSSRIVKDVTLRARVGVRNFTIRTTAGKAYQLHRADLGEIIDLETEQRVSDFFIGYPERREITYRLNGGSLVGRTPAGCQLDSPWLKASRQFIQKGASILVKDTTEIKKTVLTNAELKGREFDKFQSKLQRCFHQVALVFK